MNCPDCGKQVSTTAQSCPNCGFDIRRIMEFCPCCVGERILMTYDKEEESLTCPKCKFSTFLNYGPVGIQQQIPHCPTCGSTNIKRLFFSGGWNPKQFRCNNCGYEW